uniref:Uncharacterized protein n=1 Tax=Physcomitrium patens TaxID=3218 RepID=A9S7N7_PHYPA|nr:hypothetical protein PHYPA_030809 [Physcomitrium patens]
MSKERHHSGVCASNSRPRRDPHRNLVPPEEIYIIPGNRFFLLPLKKVSTLVDHRCRGSSATSTKACILQGPSVPSRTTIFQIGQPTNRCVTRDIIQEVNDRNNFRFAAHSSSRSTRRFRKKQRAAQHAAMVRTRLSPVSEQFEQFEPEENPFGNRSVLDHVEDRNFYARPMNSREKLAELVNADDQCINSRRQLDCRVAENEQRIEYLGRRAEMRPRRVRGDGIWSGGGVYQRGVRRWVDDRNVLTSTRLDYDFCGSSSYVGKSRPVREIPLDSWGDESMQPESGLPERQNALPDVLERARDVPNPVSAIDCSSPVPFGPQQSGHLSSGPIQTSFCMNRIRCGSCRSYAEGFETNFNPRSTTNNETCLGLLPEKLKHRLREGLEGVNNKISPSRNRKSPSSSQLESYLMRFDQSISENTSCGYLLEELKKEEPKAVTKSERVSGNAAQSDVECRGGAACKQGDLLSGEQPLDVANNRRRNRKKTRGVQIIGKNRIWPCSRPTGHGIPQSNGEGHRVLPTPQTSTNSAEFGYELDRHEVFRSGRDRRRHENHGLHQGSTVPSSFPAQDRPFREGILCLCSSLNDLPIGPPRAVARNRCGRNSTQESTNHPTGMKL